jgi:hypothetical protein
MSTKRKFDKGYVDYNIVDKTLGSKKFWEEVERQVREKELDAEREVYDEAREDGATILEAATLVNVLTGEEITTIR